eukprot:416316-Rhodomonas_salina.5
MFLKVALPLTVEAVGRPSSIELVAHASHTSCEMFCRTSFNSMRQKHLMSSQNVNRGGQLPMPRICGPVAELLTCSMSLSAVRQLRQYRFSCVDGHHSGEVTWSCSKSESSSKPRGGQPCGGSPNGLHPSTSSSVAASWNGGIVNCMSVSRPSGKPEAGGYPTTPEAVSADSSDGPVTYFWMVVSTSNSSLSLSRMRSPTLRPERCTTLPYRSVSKHTGNGAISTPARVWSFSTCSRNGPKSLTRKRGTEGATMKRAVSLFSWLFSIMISRPRTRFWNDH